MTMKFNILSCLALLPAYAGELTIQESTFRDELEFDARIIPEESPSFTIEPNVWKSYVVKSVTAHGDAVKKGDPVITFEREDYDQQLEDMERALQKTQLEVESKKLEVEKLKEEHALQLEAVRRDEEIKIQDLEYFEKIGRPAEEKQIEQSLVFSEFRLESAEEELKQLRAMYDADDVTEETEEIILKRQQVSVDAAKFSLSETKREAKLAKETELPRRHESLKKAVEQAKIARAKAEGNLPRELKIAELELKGAEAELARKTTDLERYKKDAGWLEWKAPSDGIVFHGGFKNGQWLYDDLDKQLHEGSSVSTWETLITLIPGDTKTDLYSRISPTVARALKADQKVAITLEGDEAIELTAKISMVDDVPEPDQKCIVSIEATWPEDYKPIIASTVSCKVITYENEKAIVVPNDALQATKDGTWTVEVKLADGKTETRTVKRGQSSDKFTEIIEGLEPGQVIVTND